MIVESLREIYKQFIAQGSTEVYAAVCCDRHYLGLNEALRCRTCAKSPRNIKVLSEDDLDRLGCG